VLIVEAKPVKINGKNIDETLKINELYRVHLPENAVI